MYHEIVLIGYVGHDPAQSQTKDGTEISTFSVGVKNYADRDATVWFKVSVFGIPAECANLNIRAGSLVLICGKLKADLQTGAPPLWQRKDGSYGTSFEVYARSLLKLADPKGKNGENYADNDEDYSDIPF